MSISQTGDIRLDKHLLRKKFKEIRAAYSLEKKGKLDNKITNRLLNTWRYREAEIVFCYVSFGIEVDTRKIIETSFQQNKTVAVPKCVEGTREIEFYKINSIDELEPGTFGVLEPKDLQERKITDFSQGLCIVPALGFDVKGYRLGFGKGYYDRFLSKFSATAVGLCYSDCVVRRLPHGKYDKSVDILITEKKLFTINT
ncbi:MAG TPA: 5-formyltetrahydrofolate cyclo-ligase [Clostridia bacterium]|nr:5-formyltetrahydrofolate cyclo-ligase [Clostridia bacterium]